MNDIIIYSPILGRIRITMEEVVILSANRTPIGKFGKALANIKATDLGALTVREAVRRAGITVSCLTKPNCSKK